MKLEEFKFLKKEDFYFKSKNGKYHDESFFTEETIVKEKYRHRMPNACYVMNENLIKFSNNETNELNDVFYEFILAHLNNKEVRLKKEGLIK